MNRMRRIIRPLSIVLMATHLAALAVSPAAQAALVGAEAALEARSAHGDARSRLLDIISRDEVRDRLVEHGVTPAMARQRVALLSDAEARQLAHDFDQLPAGGSFVSGFLLIVFFGWAILHATDYGGIFMGEDKPAATQ